MLDEAPNKLGVPPGDRNEEPAASVEAESAPAEENTVEVITDYVCDCGCRRPILRERRTAKVERPPVAMLRADGGHDSRDAFSHCRKRGVRTTMRVRIDSNCRSDGKDGARSNAVLDPAQAAGAPPFSSPRWERSNARTIGRRGRPGSSTTAGGS